MVNPNPGSSITDRSNIHNRPNIKKRRKNRIEIIFGGQDRKIQAIDLKIFRVHHKRANKSTS